MVQIRCNRCGSLFDPSVEGAEVEKRSVPKISEDTPTESVCDDCKRTDDDVVKPFPPQF